MIQPSTSTIETRTSWVLATVALIVIATGFGAAWITSVALKDIAAEVDGIRKIPALAGSLVWIGSGLGGILMGHVAERIGVRWTVVGGALMIGLGLAISTLGPPLPLWIGHGLFIGLLGLGGINAPLYIYVSHWFDRRRGSALALISSGNYFAGAFWPPIFERTITYYGWRETMLLYGALQIAIIVPLALLYFRPVPRPAAVGATGPSTGDRPPRLGLPPNLVFVLMCVAGICCCVPMALPQQHLVAFCSDLGMSLTMGAAMLSVLLGCGFLSRQAWGVISDRIGGLMTILIGSIAQATALSGFLVTQDEVGLFTVSAAFGLGFSGIIPAYALAARELFPAREAYWRIPTVLMCTGSGMALGGWLGGYLYDHFGYYAPAFAAAIGFNVLNIAVVGFLVWRRMQADPPRPPQPASAAA